ncbi:MAG: penicillin-binding transpeptidase domain-containing protein [Eubacteriales bacterium]|nr:penicillin-binding transpeptidase domain-containing protein [Eubacteriales bacterium]
MSIPGINSKKRLQWLLLGFTALLAILVLFRVGYWQLWKASWLQEKALDQWTDETVVEATRGSVLDRNGQYLAQSASSYMVVIRPKIIQTAQAKLNKAAEENNTTAADCASQVVTALCDILGLDYNTVYAKATNVSKSELLIKRQISREQQQQISDGKEAGTLTGVYLAEDKTRYYPNRSFLTQVLGFTSVDGEGLEGIEARYDKYLRGTDGAVISETDAKQEELPFSVETYVPPIDGNDVVLTIDSVIQGFAETATAKCVEEQKAVKATCIVMDPRTGEVLAMVNKPDFDNNDPPRTDSDLLRKLVRNTAVADAYEPGSTFKVVTLAAALDSGAINMDSTFNCAGYYLVDGEKIKCWSSRAHGVQTLEQAAQNSCNPAFMDMALRMGQDKFYEYLYNFGLGSATGIDLYGEAGGIVTEPRYVRNVDLARIGFGHAIAVTPLQMLNSVCTAVNGGKLMQPYMVKEVRDTQSGAAILTNDPKEIRQVISETTSAQVRQVLTAVVDNGSGRNGAVAGYSVGGKTGTAQKYGEDGRVQHDKHVASFVAFAPANNPQVAILLVVDEPDVAVDYGSIVAAPYVAQIMESTLKYLGVKPDRQTQDGDAAQTAEVPDVSQRELEQAIKALGDNGFQYLVEGYGGQVYKQMPAAGAQAVKGSVVMLYLEQEDDAGTDNEVTIPDVKGKSAVDAYTVLQSAGLRVKILGTGNVVAQQKPEAGTVVVKNDVVELTFQPAAAPSGE